MADVKLDLVSVSHMGEPVRTIFNQPELYQGKKIGLNGGKYTMDEIAAIFSKHFAPKVFKDGKMSLDAYRALPFPMAMELGNMLEYYQRGKFSRDVELTRKLDPNNPDLDQWIEENKEKFKAIFT